MLHHVQQHHIQTERVEHIFLFLPFVRHVLLPSFQHESHLLKTVVQFAVSAYKLRVQDFKVLVYLKVDVDRLVVAEFANK